MAGIERLLWYLNFGATLVLVFRFVHCNLFRVYPFLFGYWLVQAAADVIMFQVPLRSDLYAYLYYSFQVVNLILAVCVVQELYRMALAGHPGLAAFGRKSVLLIMGFTALFAAAGVVLDSTVLPDHYWNVHRFLTMERTMDFMILMFLLLIGAFLLWFPVRVRRNIAVYMKGFVLFYFARSGGLLLTNLLPHEFTRPVSSVMEGLTLACLLVWIWGLRAEGEYETTVTGHRWNAAAAGRLSLQLDEINAALTRFARN